MTDLKKITQAHMRTLINHIGCYDAIVEILSVAIGTRYNKGMLSRKVNGSMQWNISEIAAIQAAANQYPVTEELKKLSPNPYDESEMAGCLIDQSGAISKETGEAVKAILKAVKSESLEDSAEAIAEIRDVSSVLTKALNRLAKNCAVK